MGWSIFNTRHWAVVEGYRMTIPLVAAILVSTLLFVSQDYISPIISSHDLCNSALFSGIINYLVPKIITHCDQMLKLNIQEHSGISAAILIDIWNALCCILLLIYTIYRLSKITKIDIKDGMRKRWHDEGPSGGPIIARIAFGVILSAYGFFYVFADSPLIPDGMIVIDTGLSSISGVAVQTAMSFTGPVGLFGAVIYLRIELLMRRESN